LSPSKKAAAAPDPSKKCAAATNDTEGCAEKKPPNPKE
jgi:hypothetical protein